jgi:hypothetical protein
LKSYDKAITILYIYIYKSMYICLGDVGSAISEGGGLKIWPEVQPIVEGRAAIDPPAPPPFTCSLMKRDITNFSHNITSAIVRRFGEHSRAVSIGGGQGGGALSLHDGWEEEGRGRFESRMVWGPCCLRIAAIVAVKLTFSYFSLDIACFNNFYHGAL